MQFAAGIVDADRSEEWMDTESVAGRGWHMGGKHCEQLEKSFPNERGKNAICSRPFAFTGDKGVAGACVPRQQNAQAEILMAESASLRKRRMKVFLAD